jgi:hypothetical protein
MKVAQNNMQSNFDLIKGHKNRALYRISPENRHERKTTVLLREKWHLFIHTYGNTKILMHSYEC